MTVRYVRYDPNNGGEIVGTGTHEELPLPVPPDCATLLLEHATADVHTHYVDLGTTTVVAYSAAGAERKANNPGAGWRWDTATEDWVDDRTLEEAQGQAWEEIKAIRDRHFATIAVSSADIDYSITLDKQNLADRIVSLEASIARGLATSADLIAWRDQSNREHDLDLAGLQQLAAEMGNRGQLIYEHSWLVHSAVLAAITTAEVEGLDLEDGWPITDRLTRAEATAFALTGSDAEFVVA